MGGLTVPRAEMNAVLAAYKVLHVVMRALRQKPEKVYVFTDSMCLMAASRSETGQLNIYLANRKAQAKG